MMIDDDHCCYSGAHQLGHLLENKLAERLLGERLDKGSFD
jgi:hypothetical protein